MVRGLLVVVVLVVVGATPLLGAPAPVVLTATEFKWTPKDVTVTAGEITFTIVNKGSVEHNFVVEDAKGKALKEVEAILPGKTMTVKVSLKAGKYTIACTVPGHREAGMVGTLTVK